MSDKIDKVFDLIEKMYIEVQETKKGVKETKEDVKEIKKRVTKIEISLENEIRPNIKTLFDQNIEIMNKQNEHDKRFDTIEEKLDKHDIEIKVIKGGKRKQNNV